jgi:hypothetical protein
MELRVYVDVAGDGAIVGCSRGRLLNAFSVLRDFRSVAMRAQLLQACVFSDCE